MDVGCCRLFAEWRSLEIKVLKLKRWYPEICLRFLLLLSRRIQVPAQRHALNCPISIIHAD